MRFMKKNRKKRKNRKNKISSNKINMNKLKLLKSMRSSLNDIIHEVNTEVLLISIKALGLYEKDMDKVHLIHSEVKELMIRLKQNLKKIFNKEDLLC